MISVPRQLLIQAVFIAINAIFAGLEMAMVSLNSTKLKMLEEKGDKAAIKLLKMLENPSGFLSAIQVAISLSGFLGSAFAADSLSEPLTDWLISIGLDGIGYSTLNSISVEEMINNIFEFNDIRVSEIMTRISDVNYFSVDDDEETIINTIKESGNSRYPVYEEDINDIIGILNARDFLLNLNARPKKTVREMLRSAYFVPESIKADQLFNDMQRKKVHIAIVIDEYGETRGIITLEDLLEEIVGNIYDEFDETEAPEIEKLGDNRWRVSGTLSIEDLEKELDIDIDDDSDFDTLGGMVLACLHEIPEDGQTFTIETNGLRIMVTRVEDKRIAEAVVEKITPSPEQEAEGKED